MPKAQADIISTVIIVILALSLTSTALLWGLPLIQKRQDSVMVARMNNAFTQDLPSKIENIANTGGSTTFSLDVNGAWTLSEEENTIAFTFFSKVSDKGLDMWIGEGCPFTGQSGVVGINKPSVVCAFATSSGGGYNITYKIGFRELTSDGERGYKILLVKPQGGILTSTSKTITISRPSDGISQEIVGQKTLIKTKIEIHL